MPPIRRILVIINPTAGHFRSARVHQIIEQYLSERGFEFTIRETERAGDALRWSRSARAEGYDLVTVAGGDGTIREACEGLMRSGGQIPLAQVPTGTANVTARALSIPIDVRKSLELISNGKVRRFDIGYLPDQDRYFTFVAGAGWDARLIYDTPRELKRKLGFFAYVASGTKHFFALRPVRVTLELDSQVHHIKAHTVMGINIGSIANLRFAIAPNVDPHDGRLNVVIMSSRSLWGTFLVLLKILFKRYHGYAYLKHMAAQRIRVTSDPALPVQIDGEPLGTTPFLAEVIPGAIQFVVPIDYQ